VAQQELLDDQARLDGLAKADVVGHEQVDPRHGQGADHRVELVVLDLDAAAEGCLERAGVGAGDRPPAHGVQERLQPSGVVEAVRMGDGQHRAVQDGRGQLQLPDDA